MLAISTINVIATPEIEIYSSNKDVMTTIIAIGSLIIARYNIRILLKMRRIKIGGNING